MKRTLALILALVLCLSLAACNSDPSETDPASDAALSRGAVNGSVYTNESLKLWIRNDPDYTAVLTISSTSITDPQTILDCFSADK